MSGQDKETQDSKNKLSRRDFIKYSAGIAAVAAGAAAMMNKIPFSTPQGQQSKGPSPASGSEPMVVAVRGDELTVISGERSFKVKDPILASMLAGKAEREE